MWRQAIRIVALLALAPPFTAPALVHGGEKTPDSASEKAARDALLKFDKNWKDYTNEPHYGDPRWKLKMETLVALAKAGPAALPLIEAVAKESSSWAPHSRELASHVLKILRGPAPIREALTNYDLSQMDSAKVGKPAPDLVLADASGRSHRLSEHRGRKTLVLTFILQDI
jgi:hypothetical protein